jgi:hypothetical protein
VFEECVIFVVCFRATCNVQKCGAVRDAASAHRFFSKIKIQVVLMPLHMGSTPTRRHRQRRTRSRPRPSPTAALRHSPSHSPHPPCRTAALRRTRSERVGLLQRTLRGPPPAPWCRRQSMARERTAAPRCRLHSTRWRRHTRMPSSLVAAPVQATSCDSRSRAWRRSTPVHAPTASRRCCCRCWCCCRCCVDASRKRPTQ